jgi:hypothetical protein
MDVNAEQTLASVHLPDLAAKRERPSEAFASMLDADRLKAESKAALPPFRAGGGIPLSTGP